MIGRQGAACASDHTPDSIFLDRLPALKIMKELSRLPGSSETMATKEVSLLIVALMGVLY